MHLSSWVKTRYGWIEISKHLIADMLAGDNGQFH